MTDELIQDFPTYFFLFSYGRDYINKHMHPGNVSDCEFFGCIVFIYVQETLMFVMSLDPCKIPERLIRPV